MARNLAKKGFPITGYDVYGPLTESLVALGGSAASSPAAAVKDAAFLIFMVVNAAQVSTALFSPEGGAATALPKSATIIVTSTCPPSYMAELRKDLDAIRPDLKLLDCPVSGGSIRAAAGTLSIFSSGADEDLDHAAVVLNAMADPLYRIPGGLSMGSIAKMCHQHQAAVNIITASEVMGLAARAGLNTRLVYETANTSLGRNFMFANRLPHMLANDYKTVHSAVSIILKDVVIVTEHARGTGFPLLLANTAQQLYIAGGHAGFLKDDDAGLVRMYLTAAKHNAIGELAVEGGGGVAGDTEGEGGITIQDIIDVLCGIQLASTLECLRFAKHVEMDLELLSDIIIRGAGSSGMFEAVAGSRGVNKTTGETLEGVGRTDEEVKEGLVGVLRKAEGLGQPMPMAQAALQGLYFDGLGGQ